MKANKTRLFLALRSLLWNSLSPPWRVFEGNLEGFLGDGTSLKMLFSLQPLYLCLPDILHSRYTGSNASASIFLIASCGLSITTPLPHALTRTSYSLAHNVYFHFSIETSRSWDPLFYPRMPSPHGSVTFLVQGRAHKPQHFRHYLGHFSALTLPMFSALIPIVFDCTPLNRTLRR